MKVFRQMLNKLTMTALMACLLIHSSQSLAQQSQSRLMIASESQAVVPFLPSKKLDFGTIMQESASKNIDFSRLQSLRKSLQIDFDADSNEQPAKKEHPLSNKIQFKSGGADAGGGGDWEKIYAQEYPKRELLSQALQMAYEEILNTRYPDIFKALLLEELQSLAEDNKFKYIPSLFFIEQSLPGLQPQQRQLTEEFGSLGAFTPFKPKAFVFLSARTLEYSIEQLSKLVTHEIVHHVLDYSLTTNEEIVNEITRSIFDKTIDEKTGEKLRHPSVLQNTQDNFCRLTDPVSAEKTVHFVLDLVSPYNLASFETSNNLEKLHDLKFTNLAIVFKEQMWFRMNMELSKCGYPQISQRNQGQAQRAGDMMSLVAAKMYQQKQATFVWKSSELEEKNTGIISQILNIRVD